MFKVGTLTRAVRSGLALSIGLLAWSGSGAAMAGEKCSTLVPTAAECVELRPDIAGHATAPVEDLVSVQSDALPSSVVPSFDAASDAATLGYAAHTDSIDVSGRSTDSWTAGTMPPEAFGQYDVDVVNNTEIYAADGGTADVVAWDLYALDDLTVYNQSEGTVTAHAYDGIAIALLATADGTVSITNAGAITATSVNGIAAGIIAAANGNANFDNSGSVNATSTGSQAVGVHLSSATGYATATNSGAISATGGQDQTLGFVASGALGVSMDNSGYVTVLSNEGSAIGIQAFSDAGTATVINTGSINSKSHSEYFSATGVLAGSVYGEAAIFNSGSVSAINYIGLAVGLQAYSPDNSMISNAGYVLAGSYQGNATGLSATTTDGDVMVSNIAGGYIRTVSSAAEGRAVGIEAVSSYGDISVANDGLILAISTNGAGIGIDARGGGDIFVDNTGTVAGLNVNYGDAGGIQVRSTGGDVTVVNSGLVSAYSAVRLGRITDKTTVIGIRATTAAGVYSEGTYGPTATATVINSGDVLATGAWIVTGILAGAYGGTNVTNTESGTIVVRGLTAVGISVLENANSYANRGVGDVLVNNAGGIFVTQLNDCLCTYNPEGIGIQVESAFGGDISVTNSGSIGVNTANNGAGIDAHAFTAGVWVTNSGDISISETGEQNTTYGIKARTSYGIEGVQILNTGDIAITTAPFDSSTGYGRVDGAFGIFGTAGRPGSQDYQGGGDVNIVNAGNLYIQSDFGVGIWIASSYGSAFATNAGDITINNVDGVGQAIGIFATGGNAFTNDTGVLMVENTGTMSVTGVLNATAIRTQTIAPNNNEVDLSVVVDNSGSIFATSELWAQGITATLFNNNAVTINNSGSIAAVVTINTREGQYQGHQGNSVGIHTDNYDNDGTITNSGDVTAVTYQNNQQPGSATGVQMGNGLPENYVRYAGILFGNSTLTNTASISANLVSSNTIAAVPNNYIYGSLLQFGPANTASGVLSTSTYGDVAISNAGFISGSAQSDHNAAGGANATTTANGISQVSTVGTYDYVHAYHYVYNPDTQTDERVYDGVASTLTLGDITLFNGTGGVVMASAESIDAVDTTALANGIIATVLLDVYGDFLVSVDTGITINNLGWVSATAMTANDLNGASIANGISAINGSTEGFSTIVNSGAIRATATADGSATAVGILADAAVVDVALDSASTVSATATSSSGNATGLWINGGTITASNAGVLLATFNGAGGLTYGANITSTGEVMFTNSGIIRAANFGDAIGVSLNSETATLLTNSGTIIGASFAGESIAVQAGASADTILNSGTIFGQILTNDGDDTFNNSIGGLWSSVGSSDFGSGNDTVVNAGTIVLNDESISMGTSDAFANMFTNSGTIAVFGDNLIDMGLQNNYAFANTGIMDFRDGATNDILRINGDLGGSGQIAVDIGVLNGVGDLLYINGNVVSNSVTTVNANILDVPTTRTGSVAVVNVTGDSSAGNFVIGDVTFNPNHNFLLVTAVGMSSSIDTSNARPDVFSVDFDVSGLSDAGTLAAAFAPGVQSLMNSQIGTWRQRMGVIKKTNNGLNVWARGFSDSGAVNPDHVATNFGQDGNFTFEQDNSGQEVGVDVGFSDQFSVGLLVGRGRGKLTLNGANTGFSRLDGDTSGLYATWLSSKGFYIDTSYRRMSFDANLTSPAGETRTSGEADSFNVEAGYGWTVGSAFIVEPQVQYTRTTVDDVGTLNGALAGFTPEGGSSSRARLGVAARQSFASGNQTWTPYVALSAVREFDGENMYSVNGTFSGSTNTEGTSALVEGGVSWQVGKLAVFAGLNWQDGGALDSFTGGQVVVRYGW